MSALPAALPAALPSDLLAPPVELAVLCNGDVRKLWFAVSGVPRGDRAAAARSAAAVFRADELVVSAVSGFRFGGWGVLALVLVPDPA